MAPSDPQPPGDPRLLLVLLSAVYSELGLLAAQHPKDPRVVGAARDVGQALEDLSQPAT